MGNEYGAADLQPHLVYGVTVFEKIDDSGTTEATPVSGGHHQKMRLREAWVLRVDAAGGAGTSALTVKHAGDTAASVTEGGNSPIGALTALTIVDQYKDVAPGDSIIVGSDNAAASGDLLFILNYELVE